MITVLTGGPGNGKTAYAVNFILDHGQDRPLLVWGVDDLKLDHDVLPKLDSWCIAKPLPEDPSVIEYEFDFPQGALVVIDEAQKVFRPRSAASKVPPYVQAFERHRHHGLDFLLITQSPGLLDSNVRMLCGQHIHLYSTWKGRKLIEWPDCRNPNSKSDQADGAIRSYKLPSKVFDYYKSASIHTVVKRRLPTQVYVFAICLLLLFVGGIVVYKRASAKMGGGEPAGGDRAQARASPAGEQTAHSSGVASHLDAQAETLLHSLEPKPEPIFVILDRQRVQVGDRVLRDFFVVENTETGERKTLDGRACNLLGYSGTCDGVLLAGLAPASLPLSNGFQPLPAPLNQALGSR